ncbi:MULTISPECIES: trimeric intracellular cation channel family protein [unclassified Brevibacterium]|uniref:trimeric intracellular cation channel family protein n=1 Tax=unclassified Brevibacterium TaxID=2614124 RepID=UPI001091CE86|nr:trimeric intracellular cation channel family protein [Brevibacterium sp. S22]TGD29818.1 trimeric intracellular cation channel family protein [Brevibacterium sp. S22]
MNLQEVLFLALDLTGTFAFAVSGVLLAARRNFDITGGLVLGMLTGIGGGMIRDVLLDRVPNAIDKPIYLAPAVLATLLIYMIGSHVSRARIWIVAFDALGLGVFSVTGTTIALSAGANYPAALLMGALTACGGGVLRDAVASEDPAIFRGTDIYLLPALFGAGLTIIAEVTGLLGAIASLLIAAAAFGFRMLAWKLQWRVPQPMRQWSYRDTGRRVKKKLPSVFRKPD